MNEWIRTHRRPDIIDFEVVTRAPDNVHHFIDGLDEDGIHPNAAGHRVMARLSPVRPAAGATR